MSTAWIVSGLLYALGCVMAYVALDTFDGKLQWTAIAWPLLVIANILVVLYQRFIGDPLWRRRHAKWRAESQELR